MNTDLSEDWGIPENTPPCTDAANGALFAQAHIKRFRYLVDRQVWIRWDGKRWRDATPSSLMRAAIGVVRAMARQAAQEEEEGAARRQAAWAQKSASRPRLEAMITIASSDPRFEARVADLDKWPELLNVNNGTLDLRTGELRPHRQEDLLTTMTPVDYAPGAEAPRWRRFLTEIFAGDEDLVAFVHRAHGYSLTGLTSEQCFFLLHGTGENGKGRFVRQLRKSLGSASRTTSFSTLVAKRHTTDNTPALARLAGSRLVVAGEPDDGVRFSESTIKELTGEDEIQVCAKYEAPFEFTPRFKIWLHCNHRPKIHGTDEGIWRRPRLVPFNVSFRGRADKTLDRALDAEAEGILAWAVEGARAYLAEGSIGTCASVEVATQQYREESDVIARFLEDCMVLEAGAFTSSADVYKNYSTWCESVGEQNPMEGSVLGRRLAEREGIAIGKKNGKRGVFGLRLRTSTERGTILPFPSTKTLK